MNDEATLGAVLHFDDSEVRIGTCSWTDKTLVKDTQWYPKKSMSAAERLAFYAAHFPVVEADSTYYRPPARALTEGWSDGMPVLPVALGAGREPLQVQPQESLGVDPDADVRVWRLAPSPASIDKLTPGCGCGWGGGVAPASRPGDPPASLAGDVVEVRSLIGDNYSSPPATIRNPHGQVL